MDIYKIRLNYFALYTYWGKLTPAYRDIALYGLLAALPDPWIIALDAEIRAGRIVVDSPITPGILHKWNDATNKFESCI